MSAKNYAHLAANATTTLCPAPCELHTVCVNTKGAAANTLTLTDGANTIAVIDTVGIVGQVFLFDVQCRTNLVAVMQTGTAADVTVSFS